MNDDVVVGGRKNTFMIFFWKFLAKSDMADSDFYWFKIAFP